MYDVGLDDLFNPDPGGADAPLPGFYQWLLRGRPPQPVRIWFGSPPDPVTGELLDRSPRWQMLVSGRPALLAEEDRDELEIGRTPLWGDVWPQCSGSQIAEAEYNYLLASIEHARAYEPDNPFARPGRRIDLNTAAMPT